MSRFQVGDRLVVIKDIPDTGLGPFIVGDTFIVDSIGPIVKDDAIYVQNIGNSNVKTISSFFDSHLEIRALTKLEKALK